MKLSRVVLVGALFVTSTAGAETKSWAALKGKVPAEAFIVGSVDVAAIRATPSFPKLLQFVRTQNNDIGQVLDLVMDTCGMGLPAMLGDVAFALDEKERGVFVVSLAGTNQTKLTECGAKLVAKIEPKAKLATKVTGKITEYSVGPSDKLYTAWLAPDLFAISFEEKGSTALDAMFAGAPATGELAKYLAKANTSAAAWLATNHKGEEGIAGAWVSVTLGKTIAIAVRLTANTPKDADKPRKEANDAKRKGLERSAKSPELQKVFQAMRVGGTGAEVTVDISVPESSIPALLPAFDKVF